jgi:peptide/nickel transport system substrate-binding protein
MLMSACTSGSGTTQTTGPGTNQSEAKGPVKLVVGAPADIQHWDIHNHNYTYTEAVHQHVFDYLVYMNPSTGKFDPGLATEWKLVDPKTWEFKLRDTKFQDGTAFTADDVKWTLERVSRDTKLAEYGSNRTIKEVQVVDPHTARIITFDPDPLLLNRLSRIGSGMLPSKFLQEKGWDEFQKHPFGTGAYKVKEWVKDDHLTLTAWPEHWRGKAKVDEITFRVIPEEQTRVSELTTGGIDIALGISPDNVKGLQGNPDVTVYVENTPRVYVAMIRSAGNYCTADPKVREAIDYAIDDKALGEVVAPGMITPTLTRLIPGVTGANPDLYNKYNYDLERAKKLLAEAGYTGGKTCEIGLLSRNSAPYPDEAQTLVGMLEKAGIKVKLELLDTAAYNKRLDANTAPDIYITAFGNSMKDADLAVNFARTDRNKDYLGYSNKRMDELINAGATEMDPAKRLVIYKELSEIMATDRPQLSFFQSKAASAVRKGINWKPRTDEMLWFHDVTKGN